MLRFETGFHEAVARRADVFDKMYDSRSGAAAYYRYKPRDVSRFCRDNNVGRPYIHQSVFARIAQKGRGYNPGVLPTDHDLRSVPRSSPFTEAANEKNSERSTKVLKASRWIRARGALYLAMVLLTLIIVTVILDQMVSNGIAFLVSVFVVTVTLYFAERYSQQFVHKRGRIYLLGLAAAGTLLWLTWSRMPLFPLDALVFPLVFLAVVATICIRIWKTPQTYVGTVKEGTYIRWEGIAVCAVSLVAMAGLYISISLGLSAKPAFGEPIAFALKKMFGLISGMLPDAAYASLVSAIDSHPSWVLGALIVGILVVVGMRMCKKNANHHFETSWDVVRRSKA